MFNYLRYVFGQAGTTPMPKEVGDAYPLPVQIIAGTAGGTPTTGTVNVTTAAAIGASVPCGSVLVQSDPSNIVDVTIGLAAGQFWVLSPGDAILIPVSNLNLVYAAASGGTSSRLNYWVSPLSGAFEFFRADRETSTATLAASSSRTTTLNIGDQVNYCGRGLMLVVNVTSINAGTPSITSKVQFKDPLSAQYIDILTSAAINSVSIRILRVTPDLAAVANLIAQDIVPRIWRAVITHADAQPITYSVSALYTR
jgi:hypothetical protein